MARLFVLEHSLIDGSLKSFGTRSTMARSCRVELPETLARSLSAALFQVMAHSCRVVLSFHHGSLVFEGTIIRAWLARFHISVLPATMARSS